MRINAGFRPHINSPWRRELLSAVPTVGLIMPDACAKLLPFFPTRDAETFRHMDRIRETRNQIWIRRKDLGGSPHGALVYVEVSTQTRAAEDGAVLSVGLVWRNKRETRYNRISP